MRSVWQARVRPSCRHFKWIKKFGFDSKCDAKFFEDLEHGADIQEHGLMDSPLFQLMCGEWDGSSGKCWYYIRETTWEAIAVQVKDHDDQTCLGYVVKVEFTEPDNEFDAMCEQQNIDRLYKLAMCGALY